MIVSSRDLELILNPRIRQRVILLPVQHGEFGERKPCRARPGGVYHLRSRPPYERYRLEAGQQPTRARAVLWLVDRCEEPLRTVTVTVLSATREAETWIVRFVMGECEVQDKDRLLKAKPGGEHYTSVSSMALRGSGPEVDEDAHAKYAEKGVEDRLNGAAEYRERLLMAVSELRLQAAKLNAGSSLARKRLKTIEHNLRALQHEWRRSA